MHHSRPWILLLLSAMVACSFTAIKRVPSDYKSGDELDCTRSLTYPLLDMSLTVLAGVLGVSLISADESEGSSGVNKAGYASLLAALGVASSAVYGTYQVNRCRAKRTQEGITEDAQPRRLEDRVPAGARGGECKEDGTCDDELACDPTMRVCIPEESW